MMLEIQGYYDGTSIRPLEKLNAKPNQKVIITVMDEFVESGLIAPPKSMRGILSEYADPKLAEKEDGAWEQAVVEKHDA